MAIPGTNDAATDKPRREGDSFSGMHGAMIVDDVVRHEVLGAATSAARAGCAPTLVAITLEATMPRVRRRIEEDIVETELMSSRVRGREQFRAADERWMPQWQQEQRTTSVTGFGPREP